MTTLRSLDDAKSIISDYMIFDFSSSQGKVIASQIAQYVDSHLDDIPELAEFSTKILNTSFLLGSAVHYIHIFSLFNGFEKSKYLPIVFKCIKLVDSKRRVSQFKMVLKMAASFIKPEDIPKNAPLSIYTLLLFLNIDDQGVLKTLAEGYAEAVVAAKKILNPSFILARRIASKMPVSVYKDVVVKNFERQILRNGSKFIPLACRVLPPFDLEPNEKSVIFSILKDITNLKGDERKKYVEYFSQCVKAYDQNELAIVLIGMINKNTAFDKQEILVSLLHYIDFTKVSDETLKQVFKYCLSNQSELRNTTILTLTSIADRCVDFLISLPINPDVTSVVLGVLMNSTSPKAVEYALQNFAQEPISAALLLLRKDLELSPDKINVMTQPSKFPIRKLEVLIRAGTIEQAMEQFAVAPNMYFSVIESIQPRFVTPFLLALINNSSIPDKIISKFYPYVLKYHEDISERIVISIICPKLTIPSDSKLIIQYIQRRPALAQKSFGYIGLTQDVLNYIKSSISKIIEEPLEDEDKKLFLSKEEIYLEHSSSNLYKEMRDEIAHPNSKTNLPQLRKRFEKQKEKTIEKQKEIKESLNTEKILPVKNALALLHFFVSKAIKITSAMTSMSQSLLKIRDSELFTKDVDSLFFSIYDKIDSYRSIPKTIHHIVTLPKGEVSDWLLSHLAPSNLSDSILDIVSHHLPQLLCNSEFCEAFCDTNSVTKETNIETLYPIYLEHSVVKSCIYHFAVALARVSDVSQLTAAFDMILYHDEQIRRCALDSIAVSNITASHFTPQLFCQVMVHYVSYKSASDFIDNIQPERPSSKEIMTCYNEIFDLKNKDESLIHDIGTSFGFLMNDDVDIAIRYLISHYKNNSVKTESYLVAQQESFRSAISFAFLEIKPTSEEFISFVTSVALKDNHPTVRANIMELCNYYLKTFDKERIVDIYNSFFSLINLPPVSNPENIRLRINLIELCSTVATTNLHLSEELINCMITYNIRSSNEELRELCTKKISFFAKKCSEKIDSFLANLSNTIDTLKGTDKLLGYAYSYAAFLHAQGIASLKARNVFEFTDELSKSKDFNKRALCAFIFAGLSFIFRSLIEPSLPRILPVLLILYGDNNTEVQLAADRATDSVVKNLTKACGERVLPYALQNVENDESWRIQQAAILLVSAVIKGGTKNINKFVPGIVSSLSKAMKSPNGDVKKESERALKLLCGLITNEAVVDLFPTLVSAISNPSKLDLAIDKISHLNLSALLDPSSLAIIVPVITSGCRSTNIHTRSAAIKIIGHLPTISAKDSLEIFADDLIDPLLQMISAAEPSIRAIASSSLSAIIVVFNPSVFDSVLSKLLLDMTKKNSFAERQGYALSIASLIKTRGIEELNKKLLTFVEFSRYDKDMNIRECYVSLLGFLSHFFGADDFQSSYDITIDAVLEACSDTNDSIRTVGLRSASLIAKTFALSHPELILNPYFTCALKDNWRFRLCAVNFMKAFVLACTGSTEADDKGIRVIGEILEKLINTLQSDILYPTLNTLFVLTNDPVKTVQDEALAVWRQIIPNTGAFLLKNLDNLMERIESFVTSHCEEVRTVGANAMAAAVRKVRTRFLVMSLDKIDNLLMVEDIDTQHGALMCIYALDDLMSKEYKVRACTQLAPFLSSPYDFLRNEAIEAFIQMRRSLGEEGARHVSSELIKYVFQRAESPDDISSLSGLLSIIDQHSIIQLTHDVLKRPFVDDRARVAGKLIAACGEALAPIMSNFADRIISICAHPTSEEEGRIALLVSKEMVKVFTHNLLEVLTTRLVENMRSQQPQNRNASIIISGYVLNREGKSFSDLTKVIIRAALYCFDDPMDNIMNSAIIAIKTAGERIEGEDIIPLLNEIKKDFDSMCVSSKVRAFMYPEAFEALEPIIEKGLSSSTTEAIYDSAMLLSIIVPQLANPPSSIRKLLALIVRCIQEVNDSKTLGSLLSGSRSLFEKATSERQMLVNSLPTAYLRLFRESDIHLHQSAADALCSFADRVSTPALVVRLFLQVLRLQGSNTSATLLTSVTRTIAKIKLNNRESKEIINLLMGHLKNPVDAMRDLAAQAISIALLSSSIQRLAEVFDGKDQIISIDNPISKHTSTIILTELLKSPNKQVIEIVLPKVLKILPEVEMEEDSNVKRVFSGLVVSVIIVQPSRISEMMPFILGVIENGEVDQQVIACQSLQRLSLIKPELWQDNKRDLLSTLLNGYRFGEAALQSASSVTLFVLFNLEELTAKETETLAELSGEKEQTMDDFAAIVQQVQSDRANQRNIRLN